MRKEGFRARLLVVFAGIFCVSFLLVLQLFRVQVVQGNKYKGEAARQREGLGVLYDRGSIFFLEKDGLKVSAATLKRGYTLAINPSHIEDPEQVYNEVASVINLTQEEFLVTASKKDDPYEELARRLSEEDVRRIRDLDLPGVILSDEQWRTYPGERLAAHAVGFVGFNEEGFSGRYGIERFYDDILSRDRSGLFSSFFAQVFSDVRSLFAGDHIKEADITLTIEPRVSLIVREELSKAMQKENAQGGGAIVIEPATGAIRAMIALPDFDPNFYSKEEDVSVFTNPIIERVYEFGSVMKPLTLAAAFDAGVLSPEDTFIDRGTVTVDDRVIRNVNPINRGEVPMQAILNHSLNTGAVFVMEKMGREKFREYMYAYGFKEKTDVELPDEVSGLVSNLESKRAIEYATASFGQGVAITPIAMARALSALANGGVLLRPHVVHSFDYIGFPGREVKPEEERRVLKEETTEKVSAMLVNVVDEALTGASGRLPNYRIAAKTGTAQVPDPAGGYFSDKFVHSFFGYFPAFEPRFLVFMYLVDPKTGPFASNTLTSPFMNIAEFLINYYEIPPDR